MRLLRFLKPKDLLSEIGGALKTSASVKTVYGSPIRTSGKTIIPVAKVAYGFGGGGEAESNGERGGKKLEGEEGGGGGVAVKPIGIVEVTDRKTRYIPFNLKSRLLWLLALGFLTGFAYSRGHHQHAHR